MSTLTEQPLLAAIIRRKIAVEIGDEDMAQIFMAIASAIPCLRISSGVDFTSGNDVRQWLAAEARRIQSNPENNETD